MKKTRKLYRFTAIILVMFAVSMLLFFTVTPSFHGVILEVQHHDQKEKPPSLWVMEISPDEIKNKTESEGYIFSIPSYTPNKVMKELTAGQQVKIYFNGQVTASAPGHGEAYWVTIVDK